MKQIYFFLAFTLWANCAWGQNLWHRQLPFSAISPSIPHLSHHNGEYLVSGQNQLALVGKNNDIVGILDNLPQFVLWSSYKKDPQTGRPYFLTLRRGVTKDKFYLNHYQPGLGILQEQVFSDSLTSIVARKSPVLSEANDSTFAVFGSKFIRKIRHHSTGQFSTEWQINAPVDVTSAVWTGEHWVACGLSGALTKIGEAGNILWVKYFPYDTKIVKQVPGGFAAYALDDMLQPTLLKLDQDGNLLASKTLPGKEFHDFSATSDGGLIWVGQSVASKFWLLKTDANGNPTWIKERAGERGVSVIETPDAGFLVLYQGDLNVLYLMKTNSLGETAPTVAKHVIRDRHLSNGGFSLTQSASSTLFFDRNNIESDLIIPADKGTTVLFAHSPWIAGKDAAGNLHTSASTYGEDIGSDYRMGITSSPAEDFNRLWLVTREDIAQVRRDFEEDGVLGEMPPFDLLTWPARGNPHFRQNYDFTFVGTSPDSLPAPFVDHNGDGAYNVYDGDYPKLKGDRMLWWAFTDQAPHNETHGLALGVDILLTLYAYDCPQNEHVLGSFFIEYQIINRSGQPYSDAHLGFYINPELGCYLDDYIGTLPEANSLIVYNQDATDGHPDDQCPSLLPTFEEQVPVESISFLNQSLGRSMYMNVGGTGGNPAQSDPASPNEFYNYLTGKWRDNTPFTIGGSGYNPLDPSAIPAQFAFPDNPSDPNGWSMCSVNLPYTDQRILPSHGPFTLAAGDTFTMRLAFTFHPDIPHPCPDINTWVKPTILQIQQWHDDGTLDEPLDLGSVQTLPPGQSLTLNASLANASAYNWSNGASTPSITVSQPGEYTVSVTRASGCESVETVLVKSATETAAPLLPEWRIQPNPASDVLYVVADEPLQNVTALLFNAQGEVVAQQFATGNRLEISAATLPSGLYWVLLQKDGNLLGSKKVMVVRR